MICMAPLPASLGVASVWLHGTRIEMVGGLMTGLYPNLIQNAFFSSSVFIGSTCLWQTTQEKLISIHGSGKGSGAKAWVKQRL